MAGGKVLEVSSIEELSNYGISSVAVAVGVFDGVHLGHRKLLTELLNVAKMYHAVPVAMTFYPHPRELVNSRSAPQLLLPPEEKIRMLGQCGAEAVISIHFTKEFAAQDPDEFLESCLFSGGVEVKGLCVGQKWRFGAGASGDSVFLERKAREKGFAFVPVDELRTPEGMIISSTAIRKALAEGNLDLAAFMLGRNYSLFGTVEEGYHNATRKLDSPTANLHMMAGILPPNGVYAGFAHVDGMRYPAAMNLGVSPTFRAEYGRIDRRLELHLLDGFRGSLYGKYLQAELVSFLRPERRFANPEELKKQIQNDIEEINRILERS